MTTAKLFSEQYFGTTNRTSTHDKNIAHSPDMVYIHNRSMCILYTKTKAIAMSAVKVRSETTR